MILYAYGMRCRGFSPGCQPMKGLVEWKPGNVDYWNVLLYNRKLSESELDNYELDFIEEVLDF